MLTVVYRKRDGTDKHQDFAEPKKAFNKFYSMVNIAWRIPFISSDEHIGSFCYKDLEWYMTRDQEGKDLAYIRFEKWLNDFKKVSQ